MGRKKQGYQSTASQKEKTKQRTHGWKYWWSILQQSILFHSVRIVLSIIIIAIIAYCFLPTHSFVTAMIHVDELNVSNGYISRFECQCDDAQIKYFDSLHISWSGDIVVYCGEDKYIFDDKKEIIIQSLDYDKSSITIDFDQTKHEEASNAADNNLTWYFDSCVPLSIQYLFNDETGQQMAWAVQDTKNPANYLNIGATFDYDNRLSLIYDDLNIFYINNTENKIGTVFISTLFCEMNVKDGSSPYLTLPGAITKIAIEDNSLTCKVESYKNNIAATSFYQIENLELLYDDADFIELSGCGTLDHSFSSQQIQKYEINHQSISAQNKNGETSLIGTINHNDDNQLFFEVSLYGSVDDIKVSGISLEPSFYTWLLSNSFTLPTIIATVIVSAVQLVKKYESKENGNKDAE